MKLSKTATTIIVIAAVVSVVFAARTFLTHAGRGGGPSAAANKVKGSPTAGLHIVEFFDFQCPSCAKSSRLIDQYLAAYPEGLYLEVKYFPLRGHRHGLLAAQVAECARMQGKFWEVHDLLFKTQAEWRELPHARGPFFKIAGSAGLDMEEFKQCLELPETTARIMEDRHEGDALGIRSTPSFLVNDRLVLGFKSIWREMAEHFKDKPTMAQGAGPSE